VLVVLAVIFFLLGISVGSFLNVVADRTALGRSIVSPPSHCFQCGRKLESRDMVPVISYIMLRGSCRHCGSPIPVRSLLVELFTGLVFVQALFSAGVGWTLVESLVFISVFVVLIITDLESGTLPHRIVYPAIGIALIAAAANSYLRLAPDILSSLLGMGLGFGFMILLWGMPRLFKKRYLGFGDVGLGGLVGASLGFPLVSIALYLAVLIGGLTVLMLLVLKLRGSSHSIAFGLFLALGAIGTVLWGKELLIIAAFLFRV
jgi:prepilin signal peptidase PulO-like enzyme (type II secretory pathway)